MKNVIRIYISSSWKFFSEISGVIATLGYILIGISYLNTLFQTHKSIAYVLLILLPFVLITIIRFVLSSLNELTKEFEHLQVQNDVNKYSQIKPPADIDKILPKQELLNRWHKVIMKRAQEWSEDACFDSLNVYIDIGEKVSITMMGHAVSHWMSESAYFRIGKNFSLDRQEYVASSRAANITVPSVVPFFVKYSLWHTAVVKAYMSVSSRLPNRYQIALTSHYSYAMRFSFDYHQKMKREEAFEFNGSELKNLKSGKTISVLTN